MSQASEQIAQQFGNPSSSVLVGMMEQLADIAINVKSQGAKGDGVTDDTIAFQSAAATGKPILIPITNNFYKISGKITIKNSVFCFGLIKVFGATGDGTRTVFEIIKDEADYSETVIFNPLIDMQWDGATTAGDGDHAIMMRGGNNVKVIGGHIQNTVGDGIYLGRSADFLYHAKGFKTYGTRIINPYRMGLTLTRAKDVFVDGLYIEKRNDYLTPIDIEPNTSAEDMDNITIQNCYMEGISAKIISIIPVADLSNIKIKNNHLVAKTSTPSSSNGIISSLSGVTTYTGSIENIDITDNVLEACGYGVTLYNYGSVTMKGRVNVSHNKFVFADTNPISQLIELCSANTVEISGNEIAGKDGTGTRIHCYGAKELYVKENKFNNRPYGSSGYGNISISNHYGGNPYNMIVIEDNEITLGDRAIGFKGKDAANPVKINSLVMRGNYFDVSTAGANLTDTVIKDVIANNVYSNREPNKWVLNAGAVIINGVSPEIRNIKVVYNNGLPSVGTFRNGDRVIHSGAAAGGSQGWVCTQFGTYGALTGVTANVTNGSKNVTLNSTSQLEAGQYILITGYGFVPRIVSIVDATTITIDLTPNVSLSGASVSYFAPTMKTYGAIQA